MKTVLVCLGLFLLALSSPCSAQRSSKASPGDELFLSAADITRVHQITPGLLQATLKGSNETHAFLASQEMSFKQIEQAVSNISVAYTALKFEEYVKQVRPMLDQNPNSQYRKLLEQNQKLLDQVTAKYRSAKKNGRSALELNEAYVSKNMAAVEELLVEVKSFNVESLPRQKSDTKAEE